MTFDGEGCPFCGWIQGNGLAVCASCGARDYHRSALTHARKVADDRLADSADDGKTLAGLRKRVADLEAEVAAAEYGAALVRDVVARKRTESARSLVADWRRVAKLFLPFGDNVPANVMNACADALERALEEDK